MPTIEGFGATVVIGACFIAGLVLTLDWLLSTRLFVHIKSNSNEKAPLGLLVLLLALSYAAGILIENTSDYIVGLERDEWLPRQLMFWVDSERELKEHVLVTADHKMTGLGKDVAEAGLFSKYAGNKLKRAEKKVVAAQDPNQVKEHAGKLKEAALKVYYNAKSRVLQQDNYFTELMDIQHRIDFIRSFALGSVYLFVGIVAVMVLGLIRAVILWFLRMPEVPRQKNAAAKTLRPGSIALRGSVLLITVCCFYSVAISAYQYEEKQFNKRVFGYFISLESMHEGQSEQAESPMPSYKICELATPRPIEASGVAAFDNHLFIVNDKDNYLYVVNPEVPGSPMTVVDVPGLPDEKVKFEDIAFHPDSGYFYVIGAHYTGVDAYQKMFRFKVEREGNIWRPARAEELSISGDIMPLLSKTTSVEGLAVAGKSCAPRILVGIRGGAAGLFVIVQFVLEDLELRLDSSYELPFAPKDSSSGFAYHLSGLMALTDSKLMVLAASEDQDNGFHGNRVYTFDVRRGTQTAVTQEFAVAQKAEGITTWGPSQTCPRIAIVFDNDGEKTKQPSRLLIARSLSSLGD